MEFSRTQPKLKKINRENSNELLDFPIKEEPEESPIIREHFLPDCQENNSDILEVPAKKQKLEVEEDPESVIKAIQIDHDYCTSDEDTMSSFEQNEDEIYYEEVNLNETETTEMPPSHPTVVIMPPSPQKIPVLNHLKCPHCPLVLENTMRYNRHQRLHKPAQYQCKNCFKWYKRESSVRNHFCDLKCSICPPDACVCSRDKVTPENCKICLQIVFRYFMDYKKHMNDHHNILVVCKECETHNYGFHKHKRDAHSVEQFYKCAECPRLFKTAELFEAHMETHDESLECSICKRKFSSKYSLQEHKNLHKNQMSYHCKKCNRNFKGKFCLINHMWSVHKEVYNRKELFEPGHHVEEEGWNRCKNCLISFRNYESLKRHMDQAHRKYINVPPKIEINKLVNKLKSKKN